jgi:phosphate acyltransferase
VRVALDAMGGDRAPSSAIRGALLALDRDEDLLVDLVGHEDDLGAELGDRDHPRLTIHHASEVLRGDEPPVRGARAHPDSSLHTCLARVRDGEAEATVSAGDTGGLLAAATMILGRQRGISRPGIAVPLPRPGGTTILCDAGANLRPRPGHLMQYGLMAAELSRTYFDIEKPRVGLLSVGTEAGKGTDLVRKADTLLSRSPLEYAGLVEGHDIFGDVVDVVVCDGFTGNAVLKACEGFATSLRHHLESAEGVDFASHGGAPLLGLNGVVVICHGRSGARAIANGIRAAVKGVRHGLLERLVSAAQTMSPLARAARLLPSREGGEA